MFNNVRDLDYFPGFGNLPDNFPYFEANGVRDVCVQAINLNGCRDGRLIVESRLQSGQRRKICVQVQMGKDPKRPGTSCYPSENDLHERTGKVGERCQ